MNLPLSKRSDIEVPKLKSKSIKIRKRNTEGHSSDDDMKVQMWGTKKSKVEFTDDQP